MVYSTADQSKLHSETFINSSGHSATTDLWIHLKTIKIIETNSVSQRSRKTIQVKTYNTIVAFNNPQKFWFHFLCEQKCQNRKTILNDNDKQ